MIPPWYLEHPSYDEQADGPFDPGYTDKNLLGRLGCAVNR